MRFPDLALEGANRENPTGGGGVDDFISWVAAGVQICSDEARSQPIWRWTRPHRELAPPIPEACIGRRRGRRADARHPVLAADLPVKAPQYRPAFDWSGFYIGGHTGYSRGGSSAVLTDPAARRFQRQFQRRHRRRAGRLSMFDIPPACCSASRPISPFRTICRRTTSYRGSSPRTPTSPSSWIIIGTVRGRIGYAHGTLAGLRHRRPGLCRRALSQFARGRRRGKDHSPPARLGRRRRHRIRLRAALERAARISLQPVRTRQHSLSLGRATTIRRSTSSSCASASTARSTGRDRAAGRPRTT